jgi:HTH-type transcriptional regulator / antitoxin HipB
LCHNNPDQEYFTEIIEMPQKKLPYGKIDSTASLGKLLRKKRKEQAVTLADAAGLMHVGPRFLSELERGKQTAELGKALHVIDCLGLEIWLLPRGAKWPTQ